MIGNGATERSCKQLLGSFWQARHVRHDVSRNSLWILAHDKFGTIPSSSCKSFTALKPAYNLCECHCTDKIMALTLVTSAPLFDLLTHLGQLSEDLGLT